MSFANGLLMGLIAGGILAIIIYVKNKWARDELYLYKQKEIEKRIMEHKNDIKKSANKKLTPSESNAMHNRMGGREIKKS